MRTVPSILHIDMDAFFAAVEQRHKPSLRGKPVVVGGVGLRGVVSTASYEARVFGIGSAMPTALARRRCPNAAYLFPRFGAYHEVSQVVMGLLRELSPLVEPQSLDEAFVDLDAIPGGGPETADEVVAIARLISAQVKERTGLTASVGAGTSKLVAKVASDSNKPVGCVVVPAGAEQQWLDPLPVRKLWGVGPATADRLSRLGASTVAELRALSESELVALLGNAWGGQLYRLSRGVDEREVSSERETKSVSVEDTYPHDLMDRPEIRAALTELAERVVRRLQGERAYRTYRHGQGAGPRLHDGDPIRDPGRAHRRRPAADSRRAPAGGRRGRGGDRPDARDPAARRRHLGAGRVRAGRPDRRARRGRARTGGTRAAGVERGERDLAEQERDRPQRARAARRPRSIREARTAPEAASRDASVVPAVTLFGPVPVPEAPEARRWLAGQDVRHADRGPGWVQGAGLGRVTVRFEGPDTPPGRISTLSVDDPALEPVDSAQVARGALPRGRRRGRRRRLTDGDRRRGPSRRGARMAVSGARAH